MAVNAKHERIVGPPISVLDQVGPDTEAKANRVCLDEYVKSLQANKGALELVGVWYWQRPDGLAHVITEVRAGGRSELLRPLYEAEIVAHVVARQFGGTAPLIFEVLDLDVEDAEPAAPAYVKLL